MTNEPKIANPKSKIQNRQRRSALTGDDQGQVSRIMDRAQERIKDSLTDGRGRAGHAGTKGVDKRGVGKKTLPLPLETHEQIERIAKAENVPQGDIVMLAVRILDEMHRAGKLDLFEFKEIIYSDTQAWRSSTRLIIPDEFSFFES